MSMSGHLGGDSGQNMDISETPNGRPGPTTPHTENCEPDKTLPPPTTSKRRRRREEKRESDAQEIALLVAAAHKKLPRHKAKLIGMIYARYSSDLQQSIVDQVRELLEYAVANGIFVPLELVFWDFGIPGRKKNRPGLNAAKEALEKDLAQVILVFNSSRLYRRGYQCMKFVVEDVVSEGKRAIFLKNNIDTDEDGNKWVSLLSLMSFVDDMIARLTVPNIHAAHLGMLLNCLVHGTVTYGFGGDDVPGQVRRNGQLRRRYCIVEAEAKVVRQIFHWYVIDRLPVREIVRRLNASSDVPPPRKNLDGIWTRGAVIGLLGNSRYRGSWSYGRTQNVWNAKKDYARPILRDEPLGTKQFDNLRIVPDEIWYAAQQRLMALKAKYARDRKRNKRSVDICWILSGLFFCATHKRPLYAQSGGKYLFCPACKDGTDTDGAEDQSLYSLLPKELALRLTLRRIRQLVCDDNELVSQVIAACQSAADKFQRPDEVQLQALRKEVSRITNKISFLVENLGETENDKIEAQATLKALRNRRAQVEAELRVADIAAGQEVRVPTEDEVRALLNKLEDIFQSSDGLDEERQEVLLSLLQSLTGGRIYLHQMGERKKYHGWLQGRFVSHLTATVLGRISPVLTADSPGQEVTIDFREEIPSLAEQRADRVKQLYDGGRQMKEIAEIMQININMAIKALKFWYASRGEDYPNNALRRGELRRADPNGSLCNRITPEVIRLVEAGLTNQAIAQQLGCSKDLITKVLKRYDERHGTTYTDLKTRNRRIDREPDSDQAA